MGAEVEGMLICSCPGTLIGTLKECSVLAYPNLNALLILALTLPITSCESERSFSRLKLIKSARRATMSESRLSSLALMKIDRERCNELLSEQNMKELVQSFSQLHPRRMKLPFMLPKMPDDYTHMNIPSSITFNLL